MIGRTFATGEDQAGRDKVVVLSHGFWQRRFGGDPSVVGRKILLDGEPYDVLGVMPVGFYSFFNSQHRPLGARGVHARAVRATTAGPTSSSSPPDASRPASASSRPNATSRHSRRRSSATSPIPTAREWTIATSSMNEMSTRRIKTALLVLVGAVGFVLLIACANIANLLLARAASRTREVAVRAAVGATRTDLIRQLLAESVLLSVIGAVVGLAIAFGAVRGLVATVPVDLLQGRGDSDRRHRAAVHAGDRGAHGAALRHRPGHPRLAHRPARRLEGRRQDGRRVLRPVAAPHAGRRRGRACADAAGGSGLADSQLRAAAGRRAPASSRPIS